MDLRKRLRSISTPLLLSLTFVNIAAYGQVTATGALSGRVLDKSQAVVNGAVVKLTGADSGLQREARSNEEGLFQFELLPAGSYEVNVEMPGFSKVTVHGVQVAVGNNTTVPVTLEPGRITDVIT